MNSVPDLPAPTGPRSATRGLNGLSSVAQRLGRGSTPILLLLPALALLAWLMIYPAVDGFRLALTNWDGFSSPQSIGLENFSNLIEDKRFKEAIVHNLAIVAATPIWIGVPYAIAWGLYREIRGWRFFRFAFFLPVVLSPVVLGVYYGIVLKPDGPVNSALSSIGLGGLAREWLNDPSIALPVVIAIIIWSTFGIGVLIFLSGLANLDHELLDAANVDGASAWQIQRHVVFWQLLPVIEFWAILIVIASFTAFFPLIFTLTHGGPGYSTYTVDFYLYQAAFGSGRLGYASAIGVALLLMIAAIGSLTLAALRGSRRGA